MHIKWYDKWMEFDFFPSIELSKSHSLWNVCMPWFKEPLQMLTGIFVNCTAQPIRVWSISKKKILTNDKRLDCKRKIDDFYRSFWMRATWEAQETLPRWPETSPLFPMTKFEHFFNDLIRRGSMCKNVCCFFSAFCWIWKLIYWKEFKKISEEKVIEAKNGERKPYWFCL